MYSQWPLGELPKELERPELNELKKLGYTWSNPNEIVDLFEKKVCKFAGSKYAVATDSCSSAIFLCLKLINKPQKIKIPTNTYVSVPQQILHAGYEIELIEKEWSGVYQLEPLNLWDGAGRWTKDMYVGNDSLHVLSFQIKKKLPIGKGGMILCNNYKDYILLKKLSYDGRDLNKNQIDDNIEINGYHMYMTPEDAARGIILMDKISEINNDTHNNTSYKDLRLNTLFS